MQRGLLAAQEAAEDESEAVKSDKVSLLGLSLSEALRNDRTLAATIAQKAEKADASGRGKKEEKDEKVVDN